jgi:hypothetical protein
MRILHSSTHMQKNQSIYSDLSSVPVIEWRRETDSGLVTRQHPTPPVVRARLRLLQQLLVDTSARLRNYSPRLLQLLLILIATTMRLKKTALPPVVRARFTPVALGGRFCSTTLAAPHHSVCKRPLAPTHFSYVLLHSYTHTKHAGLKHSYLRYVRQKNE